MITKVGLYHEPKRKLRWLVCWRGDPDSETGRQRKHSRSFRHNREARVFQAAKQAELDRGAPRDGPEEVTLGRLLEEFVAARLPGMANVTQEGYKNTLAQLRGNFGDDRLVRRIDQRQAETFLATRKRLDGRAAPLSSWSKRRHLTNCQAIFAAAVSWGYIDRNPFKAVQRGNTPLHIQPKSRPWHHLTPDEFEGMLAEIPSVRKRVACWLMYACGLRPGEAYNVTTDWIDLDTRRVHVANRVGSAEVPPFTVKADDRSSESKARNVPIPEAAIPDITEAMQQAFKSGGFLVLTPERFQRVQANWRQGRAGKGWAAHGHREWRNSDMVNSLLRDTKAAVRRARIELSAPFTLNTFRKSFGQNHADAGTPPRTLAKLLGHSDTRITVEFYNRVTDANEREAARTVDRLFGAPRSLRNAQ